MLGIGANIQIYFTKCSFMTVQVYFDKLHLKYKNKWCRNPFISLMWNKFLKRLNVVILFISIGEVTNSTGTAPFMMYPRVPIFNRILDSLTLWLFNFLTIWISDPLTFWLFDSLTLWLFDILTLWLFGFLTIGFFYPLTRWPFYSLTLWLFFSLTLWLSDSSGHYYRNTE